MQTIAADNTQNLINVLRQMSYEVVTVSSGNDTLLIINIMLSIVCF